MVTVARLCLANFDFVFNGEDEDVAVSAVFRALFDNKTEVDIGS